MSLDIPIIETERLNLCGPRLTDHAAFCAYFAEPRSAWNGGPLEPHEVDRMITSAAGAWALRGYGLWFVAWKGDDKAIGFAGIFQPLDWPEPELGYGIAKDFEGKGVASEAVIGARQAAADLFGLAHLPSYIAPDNTRSKALAERVGAAFETKITLRGKTAHLYRHPKIEVAS